MKTKTFRADIENLHQMLTFIHDYSLTQYFQSDARSKIILAAEEALVNIINYGYPHEPGTIEITCKDAKEKKGLTLLFRDYAVPFNPISEAPIAKNSPPPPPSLEEGAKKGGYGIYIFIGAMDHINYQRLADGNLLEMTKYLIE